ncbi:MAG TPA: hypothetical protein VHD15_02095 [Hyphomicrobiales bacterium]|nr:hypothetical protein [Hyphomicrobiales bacterium]
MTAAIPRIGFEALAPALREQLAPRVARLGYLGEFFQCTAHQPDVLAAFNLLTEALKTALPQRSIELVALTVAGLLDNRYERHQHERLSATLRYGAAWIADVNRLDPSAATALSETERTLQRLCIALVRGLGRGADDEIATAVAVLGPAATIGVLFAVGRYLTHSLIVNALALAPPVASIFEGAP